MKVYNKLVRDNIHEIIGKDEKKFDIRYAHKEELISLLEAKLQEEALDSLLFFSSVFFLFSISKNNFGFFQLLEYLSNPLSDAEMLSLKKLIRCVNPYVFITFCIFFYLHKCYNLHL